MFPVILISNQKAFKPKQIVAITLYRDEYFLIFDSNGNKMYRHRWEQTRYRTRWTKCTQFWSILFLKNPYINQSWLCAKFFLGIRRSYKTTYKNQFTYEAEG